MPYIKRVCVKVVGEVKAIIGGILRHLSAFATRVVVGEE